VDALQLTAEEIPQLEDEHKRLANAAELVQGAQGVAHVLYDDEDRPFRRASRSASASSNAQRLRREAR